MPHDEDMHYEASFDSSAPPRFRSGILKVGAALLSGACLGLLAMSFPKFQSTSWADASLVSMPTSLRQGPMTSIGRQAALASLPGGSWKNVAVAAMEASNGCGRDISMKANPQLNAAVANMDSKSKAQLSRLSETVHATTKKAAKKSTASDENVYGLPGVLPPLNWFDPLGLSTDLEKGRLLYYREAEIKHGRVCMSSSLGFLVAERYHPLFGGEVDAPSLFAVQDSSLLAFWPAILIIVGFTEALSSGWFTTRRNAGGDTLAEGLEPGDIGYDPLGLLPTDPEELETIQNKEILNGRFAMISLLGMIAEEFVTKEKLHGLDFLLGPG